VCKNIIVTLPVLDIMKRILVCMSIFLGLISVGTSFAADNETSTDSNVSEVLEKLDIIRTNDSNISRRLLSAVPGVDGRVLRQEPAEVASGADGHVLLQTNTTTEPPVQAQVPVSQAPQEEKAACGPTLLIAIAILPLALKREI
jgi:hypothetical protein